MSFFNLLDRQSPPVLQILPAVATQSAIGIRPDAFLRLQVTIGTDERERVTAVSLDLDAPTPSHAKGRHTIDLHRNPDAAGIWIFDTTALDLRNRLAAAACKGVIPLTGDIVLILKGATDPTKHAIPANQSIYTCGPQQIEIVQNVVPQPEDRTVWTAVERAQRAARVEDVLSQFTHAAPSGNEPFRALRNHVRDALQRTRLESQSARGVRSIVNRQLAALEEGVGFDGLPARPAVPTDAGSAFGPPAAPGQGQTPPSTTPPRRTLFREDVAFLSPYELIHSFWLEVAMLGQGIRMIAFRFQNHAADARVSRLANLNVFHLRPAAGLLWDFLASQHELRTVRGRVHSGYLAELDCGLPGRAAQPLRPVRRNSSFSAAFHGLLHVALRYHAQHDDKSIHADGFPVLQALRTFSDVLKRTEVNSFARIALDARIEFTTYACILTQPEIRRFLVVEGIPAREPWLPALDALNETCGWNVGPALSYYDLAVEGERLVSSVRWMDWEDETTGLANAQAWAIHFRNSIQTYCYRMRLVCGLDLASDAKEHIRDQALPMSTLVYRRLGIAA